MTSRTRSWRQANARRTRTAKLRHRRLVKDFFRSNAADAERATLARGLAALGSSSIPLDVSRAVEDQLVEEGKPSPHDPDKTMEDDYGYSTDSMDGFLTAVSKRLKNEGHDFGYDTPFIKKALGAKLHELKQLITDRTK